MNEVAETWLVDLQQDTMTIYQDPAPDGYRSVRVARRGDRVTLRRWALRLAALHLEHHQRVASAATTGAG